MGLRFVSTTVTTNHAHYAEHSIKIDIETLSVLKMDGRFPSKKQKIVLAWLSSEGIQEKAIDIFYNLNPQLKDRL